jgi:outer membrane protein OmpA-like peptidoglycan-associated protein
LYKYESFNEKEGVMKKFFLVFLASFWLTTSAFALEEGQTIGVNTNVQGDTYSGNKYYYQGPWDGQFLQGLDSKPFHNAAPNLTPYGQTNKDVLVKFLSVLRRDEAMRFLPKAKFKDVKDLGYLGLVMPEAERHPSDMMILASSDQENMVFITGGLGTALTSRNIDETAQALAVLIINGLNSYCDTLYITVDGVDLFQTLTQFNLGMGGSSSLPLYDLAAMLIGLTGQTGTGRNQYNQPPFIKAFAGRMVPKEYTESIMNTYLEYYLGLDRAGQAAFFRKAPINIYSPEQMGKFPVLEDRINNFFIDNFVTKEMFKNRYFLAPKASQKIELPGREEGKTGSVSSETQKSLKVVSILRARLRHVFDKTDLIPNQEQEKARFFNAGKEYAEKEIWRQDLHLMVDGHTDPEGTAEYNAILGRKRARFVLDNYVLPGFYAGGGTADIANNYLHPVSSSEDNPQTPSPDNPANHQDERATIIWLGQPL